MATSLLRLYQRDVSGRISQRAAKDIFYFVLKAWSDALAAGGEVRVRGLGTFKPHVRPAHRGRNPRTGEVVELPARTTVVFHPSDLLRAAVAGGGTCNVPSAPPVLLAAWKEGTLHLSRKALEQEIALVFQCLADGLVAHESVRMGPWAIMRAVERPARMSYHLTLKTKVAVPATWAVRFAPGAALKRAVATAPPATP